MRGRFRASIRYLLAGASRLLCTFWNSVAWALCRCCRARRSCTALSPPATAPWTWRSGSPTRPTGPSTYVFMTCPAIPIAHLCAQRIAAPFRYLTCAAALTAFLILSHARAAITGCCSGAAAPGDGLHARHPQARRPHRGQLHAPARHGAAHDKISILASLFSKSLTEWLCMLEVRQVVAGLLLDHLDVACGHRLGQACAPSGSCAHVTCCVPGGAAGAVQHHDERGDAEAAGGRTPHLEGAAKEDARQVCIVPNCCSCTLDSGSSRSHLTSRGSLPRRSCGPPFDRVHVQDSGALQPHTVSSVFEL